MGGMASQTTSLTIVYSNVHSGADQRKYPRHWPLCGEFTGDRGIQMASYAENVPLDDVIMLMKQPRSIHQTNVPNISPINTLLCTNSKMRNQSRI